MEKIKTADYEEKLKSSEYVIFDFSSPGCAPCKKVPPLLTELMEEMSDTDISAYEVDITEDMEIAQKFFVLGVPTIIVFKNGNEVTRFNSVPKKDKIKKAIV
ncbi:MAG: thioredoxin family protein [bacterium]|nr:thioredoxin family protein [bacterium]